MTRCWSVVVILCALYSLGICLTAPSFRVAGVQRIHCFLLVRFTLTQKSSGGGAGDELDFNEIFAEYFINEFDDPMNAYTSTMGNFSGGPMGQQAALQQATTQAGGAGAVGGGGGGESGGAASGGGGTGGVSLPTGGIRTAFHAGTAPAAPVPSAAASSGQPMMKKAKMEVQPQVQQTASAEQQMQAMLSAQQQLQQQAGMQQQQQQQQAGGSGVSLPVGHGIRLGGVGGVSPAVTQQAVAVVAPGGAGAQMQHVVWAHPGAPGIAGIPGVEGGSEVAVAERRQRNREHAKRSRVRKKFMLESLQGEVQDLQRENQRLRMLVQEHIPDNPQQIISECCSTNPLFSDDDADGDDSESKEVAEEKKRKSEKLVKADFTLMQSLTMGQQCFVLSDPKLPDNPIVFASPGFYKLTGYTSKEVLGRNCRFLQGPATDPKHVEVLKKAIAAGTDCTVCLLNYKADGTPFWNQLFVAALRDSDNCIVNYVSSTTARNYVEPVALLWRSSRKAIVRAHFLSL